MAKEEAFRMEGQVTKIQNNAIILGCSHAQGAEMWLGEIDKPQDPADFGLLHSFASQIARALNLKIHNYSLGGGSNDAMFRIWNSLARTLIPGDTIIACWTGRHRTEVYHPGEKLWLQISAGTQQYLKRISDPLHLQGRTVNQTVSDCRDYVDYTRSWHTFANDTESATNNKIKNIVCLNVMASLKHIPVINLHSFDVIKSDILSRFQWPVACAFTEFCESRSYKKTSNGHYFRDAHTAYADLVMEKLNG